MEVRMDHLFDPRCAVGVNLGATGGSICTVGSFAFGFLAYRRIGDCVTLNRSFDCAIKYGFPFSGADITVPIGSISKRYRTSL